MGGLEVGLRFGVCSFGFKALTPGTGGFGWGLRMQDLGGGDGGRLNANLFSYDHA